MSPSSNPRGVTVHLPLLHSHEVEEMILDIDHPRAAIPEGNRIHFLDTIFHQ